MQDFTTLFSHIDKQNETVIHWQRELTVRPAIGPEAGGDGEAQKASWLEKEMRRIGLDNVTRYDCPDARVSSGIRPNISGVVPGKSGRTLWLIGHMDVVPPGNPDLWDFSPYELKVEGDYVYGRGVEDNQQAIVTGLLAADALIKTGIRPEHSLGLLFVADEETGMTYGLPHVMQTAPDLFRDGDMFLVPDIGNSEGNMVEVAEKSILWLKVTVTGKQCHASTPEKGINALTASSACVLELESLYKHFDRIDPLFSPSCSTFVPTKKELNVESINILPGKDVFYVDCRVLPSYNLDQVEEEARRIVQKTAGRYGATAMVEAVHREEAPAPTPMDSDVVVKLSEALRSVRGIEPIICGVGGQTVCAPLRHAGYHAAAWSTLIPNAHVPNERSRISSTLADAKVVAAMLL